MPHGSLRRAGWDVAGEFAATLRVRTRLVYARSEEGRRVLLKAWTRSVATAMQKRSERTRCWNQVRLP